MSAVSGFRFQVSSFKFQVSGFRSRASVVRHPSSVFCLLVALAQMAGAQEIPSAGMGAPPGAAAISGQNTSQTPPGVPTDRSPGAGKVTPKVETPEKWEQELLRDPFWPVGFFPPNWQTQSGRQDGGDVGGSSWDVALLKLKNSGTSRLGDRTAAIINGELKTEGDKVEVLYEGRIYHWEIVGIDASGKIQLKKLGIR